MNSASAIENFVLQHASLLRMGCFFGVFTIMLVWELVAPRRLLSVSKLLRWSSNLGLLVVNSVVIRLLFPAAAVGMALYASEMGWGLFNLLELPFWVEVCAAIILLDLLIYGQHLLMHVVPVLWRLHRVHHADLDIDLTTGSRFHTLEIIFSMLLKSLAILILGPAVFAVLVFEVVLNVMSIFNHSNVSLPKPVDRIVRRLLVTPDMHRVHHSIILQETNSNYGFNLSIWDRLFKTYIDQPRLGHDDMTIGIPGFRDPAQVDKLPGMLLLPFVNK